MQTEILISGFGGQGVLFAGQLLAYAAMDNGHHVTWIPSYGPEMRGGTAHCMVIISDDEIGSPLVRNPKGVIAMNMPSLDKYESLVASGGVFVVNSSLMTRQATRTTSAFVEYLPTLSPKSLATTKWRTLFCWRAHRRNRRDAVERNRRCAQNHLPERHRKLLEANIQALRKGAEMVEMVRV